MGEMTLADIAAVTDRDNNAFGGNNGGMWIFALLILLMMGGGYWNKGNQNGGGEPVTESGLCNAMNFNGLENSVGRLNDSLQADYMGLQNGLSNIGYENLRNFNETQNRISDCCCMTQRTIDGVNYNLTGMESKKIKKSLKPFDFKRFIFSKTKIKAKNLDKKLKN